MKVLTSLVSPEPTSSPSPNLADELMWPFLQCTSSVVLEFTFNVNLSL